MSANTATKNVPYHQLSRDAQKHIDEFNAEVAAALGETIPQDEDRSIFNTSIYEEMTETEKKQLHVDLFRIEVEEALGVELF